MPLAHQRHRPQPGMNWITTWSPGATLVTADPTASTIAGALVPTGEGQLHGRHVAGDEVVVGVAETGRHDLDEDLGGPGSSRSTSVTSHFPGWEKSTAALVFIGLLRSSRRGR